MRHIAIVIGVLVGVFAAWGESWDFIRGSGEYYYGVGTAATEAEADNAALSDLISQIASHVSADFTMIDDVSDRNGNAEHNSRFLSCVNSYSQATLTNTEKWVDDSKKPNITVRRYIKRAELYRIFENRIAKAKNMIAIADQCLNRRKIDMALQYYYWAYSLIRTVQFPNEVRDISGSILVDWLPVKIDQILSDIDITFDKKDGDFADMRFTYKGEPVASLEFSYSDGRTICQGLAKDGRGTVEMLPGYETDVYHLDIEYEYKGQSRGDMEMSSVLGVITPKTFPRAARKVNAPGVKSKAQPGVNNSMLANGGANGNFNGNGSNGSNGGNAAADTIRNAAGGNNALAAIEKQADSAADGVAAIAEEGKIPEGHLKAIDAVVKAIRNRTYTDALPYFTVDGQEMFNRLTNYGSARIMDESNLKFYKGLGGRSVVRGLKMAFSFTGRRKKTFVEDISFTFNDKNQIENVAFGLGKTAEDGIFNKENAVWSEDISEIIVSFMENYKTAYSLERLDYLRDIFDDDAVIIVGNVVRKGESNTPVGSDMRGMSLNGKNLIKYNRYTKDQYLDNLARCFNRNDFINLKFSDHEVQWLEKFDKETIFAINIRQEYNSATYGDEGYLFLMVDMTNKDEPKIKVRTWQPNEVSIDKLYRAGDFFND